jgi:predicted phage-related endonuclease
MSVAMNYLKALGLSQEALEARKGTLGASDAVTIAEGDPEKLMALWELQTGRRQPEDLSEVQPVQFGLATEMLNAAFFEINTGLEVTNMQESRVSPEHPWRRCTLDGLVGDATWQAKCVNAFSKEERVTQKYISQLHHEMDVCGLTEAYLSVFLGTLNYFYVKIDYDHFYAEELLEKELAFMECVKTDTPPIATAPMVDIPISEMKVVDMQGVNSWSAFAADYLANREANKLFTNAKKGLKELVDPDVGEATGHGVKIKRSKSGSLSIKEDK